MLGPNEDSTSSKIHGVFQLRRWKEYEMAEDEGMSSKQDMAIVLMNSWELLLLNMIGLINILS